MENNLIPFTPIFVVGEVMVESWNKIPVHADLNSTIQIEKSINFLGGMATNSAVALNSLGFKTELVTHLGTNALPFVESLMKKGVLFNYCIRSPEESSTVFAFLTDQGYHHYHLLAKEPYQHNSKIQTLLSQSKNCTFLLTGGHYQYFREVFRTISEQKKENKIVFSPSYALSYFSNAELEYLVNNSDIIILNQTEVERLCKTINVSPDQIVQKGPKIFVETRGNDGCKVFKRNEREIFHAHPIPVKVINPIGAGDAFNAGFLAGLLHRQNIENSAYLGNAFASICVSKLEVQVESTLEELINLCKSYYKKFEFHLYQ